MTGALDKPDPGDQGAPDPAKGSDSAPEPYTFAAPDGVQVDPQLIELFTPALQQAGVTQEHAQELFSAFLGYEEQLATKLREAHGERVQAWQKETLSDADFGRDKLQGNLTRVRGLVERFGDEQLKREVFDEYGMGNHPSLFRFLARIASVISEDTIAGTQRSPGAPIARRPADIMYPPTE